MSERLSLRTTLSLGLGIALATSAFVGCKKDEAPPPLPSAAAAPAPTPTEELTLVPEVPAVVDAGDDAGAKKGTGSGQSLSKCCAALASNAELAPEPNKTYMKTAAAVCSGAAAAGQTQGAALSMISAALKGAGMPASCK
jgi:hypothetical protein